MVRAVRTDRCATTTPALVAWVAGLAATITICSLLGRGPLSGPPLVRPTEWPSWLAAHGPVPAAMAIVRVAILVVCWYLAALTVLAAVGRATGNVGAVAALCSAAPAPARRMLAAAFGAGAILAAGISLPTAPVRTGPMVLAAADAGRTRTLRRLDAAPGAPGSAPPTSIPAPGSPAVTAGPPAPAGPPPAPPGRSAPPSRSATPPPPAVAAVPTPPVGPEPRAASREGEWVVRPGEHFWSIAEAHLTAARGGQPALREIGRYWRALVAANRDRLADPANPDLLFPGQRLRLPPTPGGNR